MDYFQAVVTEYLRADRAMFVNPECCIQLHQSQTSGGPGGTYWYCDILAVNSRESTIYLCEVSYSRTLNALFRRLSAWNEHWTGLCAALVRDCSVPAEWPVKPWLFVPNNRLRLVEKGLPARLASGGASVKLPQPKVTALEPVTPWNYRAGNRRPDRDEDEE